MNLHYSYRTTWQGRKNCEYGTAICGFRQDRQIWTKHEKDHWYSTQWDLALNVGLSGIRFKCCPTGKFLFFILSFHQI